MKFKKILLAALLLTVIVLECLPYGAVLRFANPEGEPWRESFSYFSLTPFGYANFGPLLTAVLSLVMLVLAVVCFLKSVPRILSLWKVVALLAVLTSLLPLLMLGVSYYPPLAGVISVLLVAELVVLIWMKSE